MITNATIGRGLSQEDLCRVCASYLRKLFVERQAAARERFWWHAGSRPQLVKCFLSRHPELRQYWVGTLEEARAPEARSDVVANWFLSFDSPVPGPADEVPTSGFAYG